MKNKLYLIPIITAVIRSIYVVIAFKINPFSLQLIFTFLDTFFAVFLAIVIYKFILAYIKKRKERKNLQ